MSAANIKRRARRAKSKASQHGVPSTVMHGERQPLTHAKEVQAAIKAAQDLAARVPGAGVAFAAALRTKGGQNTFPDLAQTQATSDKNEM